VSSEEGFAPAKTIIKNEMALEFSSSRAETGVESGLSLGKLSEPIQVVRTYK